MNVVDRFEKFGAGSLESILHEERSIGGSWSTITHDESVPWLLATRRKDDQGVEEAVRFLVGGRNPNNNLSHSKNHIFRRPDATASLPSGDYHEPMSYF